MYGLLIIDDEQFIVDWVYNLFLQTKEVELDIYKANSGMEALDILSKKKIDIVLSDIRMPQLSGLELLKEIRERWPFCKVIFLTAYDNFEYVHEANKDGVTYLLKTEGDDEIVKAVKKAVWEINNQLQQEELLNKAKENIMKALPIMKRELLLEMLGSEEIPADQQQLDELEIDLSIDNDLLLLVGRCDDWFVSMNVKEKAKQSAIIQTIAHKFLSPKLRYEFVKLNNAVLVWMIQPLHEKAKHIDKAQWDKTMIYLKGIIDSIQKQCKKNLGTSISFVIESDPGSWRGINERVSSLTQLMIYDGINNKEMVQTKKNSILSQSGIDTPDSYTRKVSFWLKKMHSLETFLESGQRKEFFNLFYEMRESLTPIMKLHCSMIVEVYCCISLMFITYINHYRAFTDKLYLDPAVFSLFSLKKPEDSDEAFDYFEKIADVIFLYQQNDSKRRQNAMIANLNEYIENNLDKDLSLDNLAEHVYLNRTYLSRAYKKITGENLSVFINNARINEAKKFLKESNKKVQDISNSVGFGSVTYFIRTFKESTGMTPHEYRESM